jgi:hypothetical protein
MRAVVAMLLVLVSENAHVGQLHIKKTGLEELIRRSAVIVIAEPDDPPTVEESVAIKASGKMPPPYVRIVHRYRVRESLRGGLAPGAAIAVIPADDALHERLHRDYHLKGLSRHVAVAHYEPRTAVRGNEPRILFLTGDGGRFAFAVAGSVDGLAVRADIERRLNPVAAPVRIPAPQTLVFQFNHIKLEKKVDTISLTIEPVWQDAQRGPPPDFELGRRSYRMSTEDFATFWAELNLIDWPRYAHVTDTDFETTPPDMRHSESLHYTVDGLEIASWGEGYKWLRTELRAPLLGLQAWLTQWADEQPAPAPGAFRRVMLRDVEGLNGGQNVYVYDNGRVIVQVMPAAQGNSGLLERRYEWKLKAKELDEFKHLLAKHPPREMGFGRPGIPGEAQVEIEVIAESGVRLSMRQWAADAKENFAMLHKQLLRYAEATAKRKPNHEGKYDDDWRPE